MHRLLKALAASALTLTTVALFGCWGGPTLALDQMGQTGDRGFMFKTLLRDNQVRKYALFIPLNYDSTKKYPVIIYLHRIEEGAPFGEGDGKNLTVGLAPYVARVAMKKEDFPFIVIFPQSAGGWDAQSVYAQDVIESLNDVSQTYNVDPNRVSLTGIAAGGYGTYAIGAKYHDRFAALVPMGSTGSDTRIADKLTGVAIRAYCSGSGDFFAGDNDKRMVQAINAHGGTAQFIPVPTTGPDCWEYVYGATDLFTWLQQQVRH